MIIFAIPFRAKQTTKNWKDSCKNLENTIDSIFNQTDSEFRCILACNEKPEFIKEYDSRLEIISLDIPVPTNWIEMARDKNWKLLVIAKRIREILESQSADAREGVYIMPVDGDDLLNRNIAAYVKKHPNENGFVSKSGYVDWGRKSYLTKYKNMYTFCGSCNIIKMFMDDLPAELPDSKYCHDKEMAKKLNDLYPIRWDHNIVAEKYAELGKPFAYLPFKSTIYIKNTGENISDLYALENYKQEDKRFHPVAFLRSLNPFQYKRISIKLREDFFYYK